MSISAKRRVNETDQKYHDILNHVQQEEVNVSEDMILEMLELVNKKELNEAAYK